MISVGKVLDVRLNSNLRSLEFATLTYIGGYFRIIQNPLLTYSAFPRLSQVLGHFVFCENSASFIIPNPSMRTSAPSGLTSIQFRGQAACFYKNGTAACGSNNYDICP